MAKNENDTKGSKAPEIKWKCNNKMWFSGEPASIDLRKASPKRLAILKEKYPQHFY
jgi:hypothetical protein